MRVAITGALGFIGTEVVSLLEGSDDEVIMVDFWQELIRRYEASRFQIIDRVYRNIHGAADVMDPWSFIESIPTMGIDAIIHLGAVVDTMDLGSPAMFDLNVSYVRSLVDRVNSMGSPFPGIVFASSAAIYGLDFTHPVNPYGLTKSIGEKAMAMSHGQYANLRFFNVFGSLEDHKCSMASIPFKIAQAYKKGDRFDMHSLFSSRDFVPVGTVARHCVDIARRMARRNENIRKTFDVGTGASTTFAELDAFIMRVTGNVVSFIREVPIPRGLIGRYQTFTCAGMGPDHAPVLGMNDQSTREGIEEHYGRH